MCTHAADLAMEFLELRPGVDVVIKRHTPHCRDCKRAFEASLSGAFGDVRAQHSLDVGATLADYIQSPRYEVLSRIYAALQQHRGHAHFVKARRLPPVDYYIPSKRLVIEFDEPQHFTLPRLITLRHYPKNLQIGFDRVTWSSLCAALDRHDGAPPYRDEQRAWYDTLRDFATELLGCLPIARIAPTQINWCTLNVADRRADTVLQSLGLMRYLRG